MRDLGLGGRARSRIVALRGAGADAGLSPSPAATRDLCSMNLEALRFSKRTGRKGGVTQKKMDESVAAFAENLRAHSSALGDMTGMEWRLSETPVAYEPAVAAMETRAASISAGSDTGTHLVSGASGALYGGRERKAARPSGPGSLARPQHGAGRAIHLSRSGSACGLRSPRSQ